MIPIKARRYIMRDDCWVDVYIYGFVAITGISLTGSAGSTISAIYTRKQGDGRLEVDNIETFRITEEP